MKDNDINIDGELLCKECGLCCEGVFHSYAYSKCEEDEVIAAKAGIPIVMHQKENTKVFLLPCPVYNNICTIYPDRPSVCINHQCDLLKALLHGSIHHDKAKEIVIKMKKLLNGFLPELKKETNNASTNNPMELIRQMSEGLEDGEDCDHFKRKNKELYLKYGLFLKMRKQYFYK